MSSVHYKQSEKKRIVTVKLNNRLGYSLWRNCTHRHRKAPKLLILYSPGKVVSKLVWNEFRMDGLVFSVNSVEKSSTPPLNLLSNQINLGRNVCFWLAPNFKLVCINPRKQNSLTKLAIQNVSVPCSLFELSFWLNFSNNNTLHMHCKITSQVSSRSTKFKQINKWENVTTFLKVIQTVLFQTFTEHTEMEFHRWEFHKLWNCTFRKVFDKKRCPLKKLIPSHNVAKNRICVTCNEFRIFLTSHFPCGGITFFSMAIQKMGMHTNNTLFSYSFIHYEFTWFILTCLDGLEDVCTSWK